MASSERTENAASSGTERPGATASGTARESKEGHSKEERSTTSAEEVSGSLAASSSLEGATISCLTNAQYHSSREAFLDTVHRWFMFCVIGLGTAALTDMFPNLKEICAAGVAILAALDLTFDLSNRARFHSVMKRRYYELLANVRDRKVELNSVKSHIERLSADEEPQFRVVYLTCWNTAQETVYGDTAMRFDIPFISNIFKNWWRRSSVRYKVLDPRSESS